MSTQTSNNLQQQATVLDGEKVLVHDPYALKQGYWGSGIYSGNYQQEALAKTSWDSSAHMKREQLCYATQLPQGQQVVTVAPPPPATKQTLPVTIQGFSQGAGLGPGLQRSPVMSERNVLLEKQQPVMAERAVLLQKQHSMGQTGVIPLKPICIEQEAVTFSPQRITIEQPPLTIQPEPITIPQPPIVIHPEPIVIPQAPLFFQPGPITLPRQALSFQPEQITLNRPCYSVQPFIQYELRGSKFAETDLKNHVYIKLTNDQLMRQQYGSQYQGLQGQQFVAGQASPVMVENQAASGDKRKDDAGSSNRGSQTSPAKFFSRDRNYDYGLAPTTGDKFKDALGIANLGPERPELVGFGAQTGAVNTTSATTTAI
jgi:hypothetical protein